MHISKSEVPSILLLGFGLVLTSGLVCRKDEIVDNLCKQDWPMCVVRRHYKTTSRTELEHMRNCTSYDGDLVFKVDDLYKQHGEDIRPQDLERCLKRLRLVCGLVYADKRYNVKSLPLSKRMFEISPKTFLSVSSECGDGGLLRVLGEVNGMIKTVKKDQKILGKKMETLEKKLDKSKESQNILQKKIEIFEQERENSEKLKILSKVMELLKKKLKESQKPLQKKMEILEEEERDNSEKLKSLSKEVEILKKSDKSLDAKITALFILLALIAIGSLAFYYRRHLRRLCLYLRSKLCNRMDKSPQQKESPTGQLEVRVGAEESQSEYGSRDGQLSALIIRVPKECGSNTGSQ